MNQQNIQLRGHCPHCGRQQAVVAGGMAKHGYTVEHGYFNGECSGSGRHPMERPEGQLVAEDHVARLNMDAEKMLALKFKAPAQINVGSSRHPRMVDWADLNPFQQEAQQSQFYAHHQWVARQVEAMADFIEQVAAKVDGQPLLEVEREKAPARVQRGDKKILFNDLRVIALRQEQARVYYAVKVTEGPNAGKWIGKHHHWVGVQAWRKAESWGA